MNKCWSKLINWEEIWNFTPINQLLRPDYLGVGTTGEESGGEGGGCAECTFDSTLQK